MKTLKSKNPWALLIVAGIKDFENGTWRTKFRGRICIMPVCRWLVSRSEIKRYNAGVVQYRKQDQSNFKRG